MKNDIVHINKSTKWKKDTHMLITKGLELRSSKKNQKVQEKQALPVDSFDFHLQLKDLTL